MLRLYRFMRSRKEKVAPGLSYHGKTTMSTHRSDLGATSIGDYALFAGGMTIVGGSNYTLDAVDAFTADLERIQVTPLSEPKRGCPMTTFAGYALLVWVNELTPSIMEVYDGSLTKQDNIEMPFPTGMEVVLGQIGNYLIIGNSHAYTYNPYVYDDTLTFVGMIYSHLDCTRPKCASTGNYLIFAGGVKQTSANSPKIYQDLVVAYSHDLTEYDVDPLDEARIVDGAASAGNIAVFVGGGAPELTKTTDAYDSTLTKCDIDELKYFRENFASVSLGPYAIFSGGYLDYPHSEYTDTMEVYGSELTRLVGPNLSVKRESPAGAVLGDLAFLSGGVYFDYAVNSYATVDAVDVIEYS